MNRKLPLATALVAALVSPAALAAGLYGGLEAARVDSTGDRLPYGALDTPGEAEGYVADHIGYGDGHRVGAHLGYAFENKLFVELAYSRSDTDNRRRLGENPLIDEDLECQVSPVQGTVGDCYNQAVAGLDFRDESLQLVLGRDFQPFERTTLSPYVGVRRIRYDDQREIEYNYNNFGSAVSGYEIAMAERIRFDDTGWVAGMRWEQQFAPLFLRVDLAFAAASGDRERDRLEIRTLADAPFDEVIFSGSEGVTVRHRDVMVALGRDFAVGGNTMTVMLGYRQRQVDGLDTRNTNDDSFAVGELGRRDAAVESNGGFLSVSFAQGKR